MSIGFTKGKSGSTQSSESTSTSNQYSVSGSNQSIAFQDIFSSLFGNASGAASRASIGAADISSAARQLFTGGFNILDQLGGDAGTNYLQSRLTTPNAAVDEQIGLLQEDVGRLFNEELNPAITARAVAGGTLGGGRQGVAQGLAMRAAADQFTRGAAALRSADVAQRDSVAGQVAANSLSAANTGLGALDPLLSLIASGNNAELGVYSTLSQILGSPTTLTTSSSTSVAQAFAKALSKGSSSGSNAGLSFGFGGQNNG